MNYSMFDEIDYFTNLSNMNDTDNNQFDESLFSPYEGYIRGNLFKNLYDGYKNFSPQRINIQNEREEMLLNIGQLSFVRHELNLLLDNYPNNQNALMLFNRYREKELEEVEKYERKYGPINITSSSITSIPFAWTNDKWPWER